MEKKKGKLMPIDPLICCIAAGIGGIVAIYTTPKNSIKGHITYSKENRSFTLKVTWSKRWKIALQYECEFETLPAASEAFERLQDKIMREIRDPETC